MDEYNDGPYEQQLYAVFESCLTKGQTELKEDDLFSLCNKLHLDEHGDELKACIQKCILKKQSISFQEFRDGLLLLLGKTQQIPVSADKEYAVQSQQDISISNHRTKLSNLLQSKEDINLSDNNTQTDLVLHKSKLRGLWEKVNTCLKDNVDSSEVYYISNYRGIPALPKQVAQRIFEKLDQNSDGLISLDEFLDIFKNRAILQEQFILPCKDISAKCLTSPDSGKCSYDIIKHKNQCFFQYNTLADMWKIAGIPDAASLLSDLGFNTTDVNPIDLGSMLCDELKSLNESLNNTDIQSYITLLKGVLIIHQEELRNLNIFTENIKKERDKLRIDINDANEQAQSLAQEIDEHHARQEDIKQNFLKQVEHRHTEIIKDLSNQLASERETNTTTIKIKDQQLQEQLQEIRQVKNKLVTIFKENQTLESENEGLRNCIEKLKYSNNELLVQIKTLAAEHDEIEDIEVKKEEEVIHLIDRIRHLQSEMVLLRDQNDELTMELERVKLKENNTENIRKNQTSNCMQTTSQLNENEDAAATTNVKDDIQINLKHNENVSCNGLCESNTKQLDLKDFKILLTRDLKTMSMECGNCALESCCFKEGISSIINKIQSNSYPIEEIDFSQSLASELESEYEERTSESLRDFVVSKLNKSSSAKRIILNSTDGATYIVDNNFDDHDAKNILQNKMTSLRDYPPRKEEHYSTDQLKKENDIKSNITFIKSDTSQDFSNGNMVINEKENWHTIEKKQLIERCIELERSLDLLKAEYEECEDYWAAKLEEERQLFEQEQKISDEKFSELIGKIAEYEELISPTDKVKNGGRLSPIEEKFNLEQQYLDLEEEFEKWKIHSQKDIMMKDDEIQNLCEKLKSIEALEKHDVSIQVQDDVSQQLPTFSNHTPFNAYNILLSTQPHSNILQCDADSSNSYGNFKLNEILESSKSSIGCISEVTRKEVGLDNYNAQQFQRQYTIQDTNNAYKCENLELRRNKVDIDSQSVFMIKEEKKHESKCNFIKKEKEIFLQDAMKLHSLKSLNCSCVQNCTHHQMCSIDISVLESLNNKLQTQERKKRQMQDYFKQYQHHIELVFHHALSQHQMEVSQLQCLLRNTQEQLQFQIQANAEQAERLARADILAKDLFIENVYLISNMKRLEQHCLLMGVNNESTSI